MFELRRIKIFSLLLGTLQAILLFVLFAYIVSPPATLILPSILILVTILISISLFACILFLLNLYQENNKELTDSLEHKNIELNKLLESRNSKKDGKKAQKQETFNLESLRKNLLSYDKIENYKLDSFTEELLIRLSKEIEVTQSLFFVKAPKKKKFELANSYAFYAEHPPQPFALGEGISGQVAKNQKPLYLKDIPENYMTAFSGLGISKPQFILIIPVIKDNASIGIIEIATFRPIPDEIQEELFNIAKEISKDIDFLAKEEKP